MTEVMSIAQNPLYSSQCKIESKMANKSRGRMKAAKQYKLSRLRKANYKDILSKRMNAADSERKITASNLNLNFHLASKLITSDVQAKMSYSDDISQLTFDSSIIDVNEQERDLVTLYSASSYRPALKMETGIAIGIAFGLCSWKTLKTRGSAGRMFLILFCNMLFNYMFSIARVNANNNIVSPVFNLQMFLILFCNMLSIVTVCFRLPQ